jgi:hypothetical protein
MIKPESALLCLICLALPSAFGLLSGCGSPPPSERCAEEYGFATGTREHRECMSLLNQSLPVDWKWAWED